jgi:predicted nucleic acid-binding protein
MTETCHLLLQRRGAQAQQRFLQGYTRGAFEIFDAGTEQLPRILQLMDKYADLPMDLADASLVILAEGCGSFVTTLPDQESCG